jgi:hypothetical protein
VLKGTVDGWLLPAGWLARSDYNGSRPSGVTGTGTSYHWSIKNVGGAVTPPESIRARSRTYFRCLRSGCRRAWAIAARRKIATAKDRATSHPLSDRSLCLRAADRRQAQAAFGGRFARLDPGQPPEAWLGIGFRDRSGSPPCGCERRGAYLAWAKFGSNGVCRSSRTQARPSSRSATPRSARPCDLPRRRSAA